MKIAKDKMQHIIVCAIVAVVIALVVAYTCALPLPSCVAGFLGATACGLGKEYGDSKATETLGVGRTSPQTWPEQPLDALQVL